MMTFSKILFRSTEDKKIGSSNKVTLKNKRNELREEGDSLRQEAIKYIKNHPSIKKDFKKYIGSLMEELENKRKFAVTG